MAASYLHLLMEHPSSIPWSTVNLELETEHSPDGTVILVSEEYLIRSAVKEQCRDMKRREEHRQSRPASPSVNGESQPGPYDEAPAASKDLTRDLTAIEATTVSGVRVQSLTAIEAQATPGVRTRTLSAIEKRVARLQASAGGRRIVILPRSRGSLPWWQRHLLLQPDCHDGASFNTRYVATLHSSLLPMVNDPLERQTMGEDSLGTLARDLLSPNTPRRVVLIDGMDASLVVTMWCQYLRRERDLWISTSLYPSQGISITNLRGLLVKKHGIAFDRTWENFLFCLPFALDTGLPPLLMLQYHLREYPVDVLAGAVSHTNAPILCMDKSGELAIDLIPLLSIVTILAGMERTSITEIHRQCQKRQGAAHCRDYCLIGGLISWEQYRQYHYNSTSGEIVRRWVAGYIDGLIQIARLCRGEKFSQSTLLSSLPEAPFAADIASVLNEALTKSQYWKSSIAASGFARTPDSVRASIVVEGAARTSNSVETSRGEVEQSVHLLGRLHAMYTSPLKE